MLLDSSERRLLLEVLRKITKSHRGCHSIYDCLVPNIDTLRAIAKGARVVASETPSKQGRKVAKALETIYGMLLNLYRDMGNQSRELCDLLVEAVEGSINNIEGHDVLIQLFNKYYDYIVSRIPIDMILFLDIPGKDNHYVLIASSPADVLELCDVDSKLCENVATPKDVLLRALQSSACSEVYYYLIRLARERAEFDLGNGTLRICGREVHASNRVALARILLVLGLRHEYNTLYLETLGKICSAVVKALGVKTHVEYFSYDHEVILYKIVVPLSAFVGLSESPRAWIEIELPTFYIMPHSFTIFLQLGYGQSMFVSLGYSELSCQTEECVADSVANYLRSVNWDAIGRLVDAAWTLVKQGFTLVDINREYDSYSKIFNTSDKDKDDYYYSVYLEKMVDDRTVMLATCSTRNRHGNLLVELRIRRWARGEFAEDPLLGEWDSNRDVIKSLEAKYGANVSVSKHWMYLVASLDDHRVLPNLVQDMLSAYTALIEDKKRLYDSLNGNEAAVLCLLNAAVEGSTISKAVEKSTELPWDAVAKKGMIVLKQYTEFSCESVDMAINDLFTKGMIKVDNGGFLTVLGLRVVDVAGRYLGQEKAELVEAVLASRLAAYLGKADGLLNASRVDGFARAVLMVFGRTSMVEKGAWKLLTAILGSRELWGVLSRGTKDELAKVLGKRAVDEAISKGWDWVLGDGEFLLRALNKADIEPSELTEMLVKYVPHVLGDDFEVVQEEGTTFLKVGRALLQVAAVEDGCLVFRGTITGCNIGAIVRARNASEAASAIVNGLIESYLEFKRSVDELMVAGEQVETGYYDAGLFRIPYVKDRQGKKTPLELDPRNC